MTEVTIPLKLPSLNDYVRVCRTNKYQAASFKKNLEEQIGWFISPLPRFEKPIRIRFLWLEGNKKRDYDNVAFAKKFILDALVKYKKLPDDNRKYVVGFSDEFVYAKETKVILFIEESDDVIK